MRVYNNSGSIVAGIFTLSILAVVTFVGTISLDYAVETWAHYLGHTFVEVPAGNPLIWVAGALTSQIMVPVAFVTYVAVVSGII